jgi:hypothetical protein
MRAAHDSIKTSNFGAEAVDWLLGNKRQEPIDQYISVMHITIKDFTFDNKIRGIATVSGARKG